MFSHPVVSALEAVNYGCHLVGGWGQILVVWESEHPSGGGVKAAPVDEWAELVFQAGEPKVVAICCFTSLTLPYRLQA